jgi:hypothetical protein
MIGRQRSRHDTERMVFTWSRITQANPWHRAPARFGDDSMIWVIGAILDIALAREVSADANERLVRAAVAHGDQRRLQGSDESRILDEYRALATALRCRLRVTAPPSALIRLDHVMTVVIAMAMQGFYRSDRGPTPSWADQLEAHIVASSLSLATLFESTDVARTPARVREIGRGSSALADAASPGATRLDFVSLAVLLNPVAAAVG